MLSQDLPPIHRFLNRLLALPIQVQNDIFDSFVNVIAARTEAAIDAGTLDRGVEELLAIRINILADHLLRTDPVTHAETRLIELTIEQKRWTQCLESVLAQSRNETLQPMVNRQSKRVCLAQHAYSVLDDQGQLLERLQLLRPTGSERITTEELGASHWERADINIVRTLWQQELEQAADEPVRQTLRVVTGSILPVWHLLKGAQPTVYRLTCPGMLPILGRVVQAKDLPRLTAALGVTDRVPLTPAQILAAVMEEGETFSFTGPDALLIKAARVNGHKRLELIGVHGARLPHYKAMGCFTEIIGYKTRLFVPEGRGEAVIADILANHSLQAEMHEAA
jgi:C-terminal domain on Strawberry notch homologue